MTDTHQQLRYAGLWVLCGWAFVALVVFLSLTPNPPEPRQLLAIDVGHLLAYAWLMFWFTSLYPAVSSNVYTAAGLCLMGIALECLQGSTDYRTLSYVDMRRQHPRRDARMAARQDAPFEVAGRSRRHRGASGRSSQVAFLRTTPINPWLVVTAQKAR